MDEVVLDSSVILAAFRSERGGDVLLRAIEEDDTAFLVSSVNFCEVATRLALDGMGAEQIQLAVASIREYVVDFSVSQALLAAELARKTKSAGLSLGDRACLALAKERGAEVWTMDRVWVGIRTGVKVTLLRQ